jgi:membrane protein involved in colicin uptake
MRHPDKPVTYKDDRFSEDELAILKADPALVVVVEDNEPKAKAEAKPKAEAAKKGKPKAEPKAKAEAKPKAEPEAVPEPKPEAPKAKE